MLPNATTRLFAPALLMFTLAACNIDGVQVGLGASESRATRTAGHPAWGNPGWTMRHAYNGQCDDPRYAHTTGKGEPGGDYADCAERGGGMRP